MLDKIPSYISARIGHSCSLARCNKGRQSKLSYRLIRQQHRRPSKQIISLRDGSTTKPAGHTILLQHRKFDEKPSNETFVGLQSVFTGLCNSSIRQKPFCVGTTGSGVHISKIKSPSQTMKCAKFLGRTWLLCTVQSLQLHTTTRNLPQLDRLAQWCFFIPTNSFIRSQLAASLSRHGDMILLPLLQISWGWGMQLHQKQNHQVV